MLEEIKEIIRNVEAVPGTKFSSIDKANAMIHGYEDIRDWIFTQEEIERMREVEE